MGQIVTISLARFRSGMFYTDPSLATNYNFCSPITTVSPSSEFWGINQSILYGTTTILAETAGIVDTGK